ncbi:Protein PLANT CADMIUM RESISTANCE 2 [Thelohanellus kitauei]|uniref:Protein PLANT CADMIUM RESISTANCE 2 n=1 Tax=Thelohanellus kitauei TaxID=669202 RepID=A0A0C2MPP9_THEKT|nr:Protein PLANT CADMIUM RESISTANCE 2 [Thelohanellus kitauei]
MGKEFKQGLFGCCGNCKNCCCSFCCPCITVGKTAEKVGDGFVVWCLFGCVLPVIAPIFMRNKVRQKNDIDGSLLGDILAGWCCTCCAVSQFSSEVGVYMER